MFRLIQRHNLSQPFYDMKTGVLNGQRFLQERLPENSILIHKKGNSLHPTAGVFMFHSGRADIQRAIWKIA